jgi:hypothetical protein
MNFNEFEEKTTAPEDKEFEDDIVISDEQAIDPFAPIAEHTTVLAEIVSIKGTMQRIKQKKSNSDEEEEISEGKLTFWNKIVEPEIDRGKLIRLGITFPRGAFIYAKLAKACNFSDPKKISPKDLKGRKFTGKIVHAYVDGRDQPFMNFGSFKGDGKSSEFRNEAAFFLPKED